MPAYAPTTKDRLSIIWTGDPAVDKEASDLEGYQRTLDRTKLVLTGEPRVYHLRPLSVRERTILMESTLGGVPYSALAYDVMAVALLEVSGPHPLPESKVRIAKVRTLGLVRIPDASPLWEDVGVFPPSAVLEVADLYLRHSSDVEVHQGN